MKINRVLSVGRELDRFLAARFMISRFLVSRVMAALFMVSLLTLGMSGSRAIAAPPGTGSPPGDLESDPLTDLAITPATGSPEFRILPHPGTRFGGQPASFNAWQVLGSRMDFALNYNQPAVDESLQRYLRDPGEVTHALPRAELYLPYITERMVANNLPPELALLPFMESAYNPSAQSPRGASGLWQITPATADRLGLTRNRWWDGRNDLIHSTDAAIDYLSYLNRRFDGDWLLSLAAYNSGEGTVSRAIAVNERKGEDTDFWALDLPDQARAFVPKFLALAKFFQDSDQLPEADPTRTASAHSLQALTLSRQISLTRAAKLADIDYDLLKRLNPGIKLGVTPPQGPHQLVLPQNAAQRLLAAIAAAQ